MIEEFSRGHPLAQPAYRFDDLGLRKNETFRTEVIARLPKENSTEDQLPPWARSPTWTGVALEAP
jgi:hypothetical protein